MRKLVGSLCGLALLSMPVLVFAQEDGGNEDVMTVEDAAVADAYTPPEDAGTVTPDAMVEDGGSVVGPCGDLTIIGECSGNQARYCAYRGTVDEEVIETDCTHCGLVDCADGGLCYTLTTQTACDADSGCMWDTDTCYPACWGYDCISQTGEDCAPSYAEFCEAGLGCMDGVCAATAACDPDTHTTVCNGNVAEYCSWPMTNVAGVDCSAGGAEPYICGTDSGGDVACLGTAGGQCDLAQGYECAPGLDCQQGTCVTGGTDPDAGGGDDAADDDDDDDSADDDDDDDDGGCGCSGTQAGTSAALLLAGLMGLALFRRRR